MKNKGIHCMNIKSSDVYNQSVSIQLRKRTDSSMLLRVIEFLIAEMMMNLTFLLLNPNMTIHVLQKLKY